MWRGGDEGEVTGWRLKGGNEGGSGGEGGEEMEKVGVEVERN